MRKVLSAATDAAISCSLKRTVRRQFKTISVHFYLFDGAKYSESDQNLMLVKELKAEEEKDV